MCCVVYESSIFDQDNLSEDQMINQKYFVAEKKYVKEEFTSVSMCVL